MEIFLRQTLLIAFKEKHESEGIRESGHIINSMKGRNVVYLSKKNSCRTLETISEKNSKIRCSVAIPRSRKNQSIGLGISGENNTKTSPRRSL